MKEDTLSANSPYTDNDKKNLKHLLDAFGSIVSLEEIASAFCQAGRDVNVTAEILCNQQDNSSAGSSKSESQDTSERSTDVLSECSKNHSGEDQNPKLKQKRCPAAMGTVSGLIGKEYAAPRPQRQESNETCKPLKLNSTEIPVMEIWEEKGESEPTSRKEPLPMDVEEFLYGMLGNGFQLEKSVIRDVVGQCGFDVGMSIDKLLNMSAAQALEKSDDIITIASGDTTEDSDASISLIGQSPPRDFGRRSNTDGSSSSDEVILSQKEKKIKDVQKEVLNSLFSWPGKIEKLEISRPVRPSRKSSYGRSIAKTVDESFIDDFTFIKREPVNSRNDEDGNKNGYDDLRKAVMEYWVLMKRYYKAAADAFADNDFEKAKKLQDEGNFYMKLAREADEKSSEKLVQDSDDEEELSINVHCLDPKEALKHLKLNLRSYAGIPSFPKMKVVLSSEEVDTKAKKRKLLITKFLEAERIPWMEEDNEWTISISLNKIDPDNLSFSKK